ncbi:MAG: ABC transporter permease [Rhodothermales bacterium]
MAIADFHLETAIATWRRFQARQAFSREDLDELERHLRDHTAHLVESGLTPEAAFHRAVEGLGDLDTGATEYRKVHWAKLRRRGLLVHELQWRLSMLRNYLTVAWRSMRRHPGYTAINLTGLAVGLAASLFIGLWVVDELKVDRFYAEGDQVHQVWRNVNIGGDIYTWGNTSKPLAPVLQNDYPEVETVAQVAWTQDIVVAYEGESFRESGTYLNTTFFEVFPRPFLQGDPSTALNDPQSVVLSERTARKLFGDGWNDASVLGQPVTLDRDRNGVVTGVIEDWPTTASFQYDVMLALDEFSSRNSWVERWGNNAFWVFVKLRDDASPEAFSTSIANIVNENEAGADEVLFTQPYGEIYLHGDYADGVLIGGRIEYVRLFGIVAVVLLLIAAINFMNLTTARSSQRAKEIGVRKAIGAERRALIGQFLGEALVLAGTAFVLAMALVLLLLPAFNNLTGKAIALGDLGFGFMMAALGATLLLGLLAGSYPALYLSSFQPLAVLRGTLKTGKGSLSLRRVLVVTQFALSTLLIVATIAVYQQLDYIHTRDTGMDRNNLIMVPQEGALSTQYDAIRAQLLNAPGIAEVTAASASPMAINRSTGGAQWEGRTPDTEREVYLLAVNYGFMEALRMDVAEGRLFDRQFGADSAAFVINEEMARVMGGEALGKRMSLFGIDGNVIGVVRDFDMNDLYDPIEPVVMALSPGRTEQLFVRAEPGQTAEALASLESIATEVNPDYPFEYSFMDENYAAVYASEAVLGRLANIFAFIAILVSCLGLLGLIAYTVAQRTKEIGVRKVLGATVPRLVLLLTKEVTVLVGLGILIALPVAYYGVQQWLGGFQQHIDLNLGLFLGAGALALGVAWLTVSYQSMKAAMADPVESLRYE